MSDFTKGPWAAQATHPTPNKLDQLVMNAAGTHVGWAYRNEDAHLISAAPELYEALSYALADYDNWVSDEDNYPHEHLVAWSDKARAALAKARGEA